MKLLTYPEIHELTMAAQKGDFQAVLKLTDYAKDLTGQLVFLERQISGLKEQFDRLDLTPKQD
jgi:hypothetical protein